MKNNLTIVCNNFAILTIRASISPDIIVFPVGNIISIYYCISLKACKGKVLVKQVSPRLKTDRMKKYNEIISTIREANCVLFNTVIT